MAMSNNRRHGLSFWDAKLKQSSCSKVCQMKVMILRIGLRWYTRILIYLHIVDPVSPLCNSS
ncbi:Uncharacterized protein APZ42_024103 [Daphnia magna]|uniref:Uncharacterized protein n=1 Tax=Daphnia magna TaxID=35525 RepID=A0A164UEA3_9CRUS|nr:Uncharacterized protein APZ42_024103 [Daphnia magna]